MDLTPTTELDAVNLMLEAIKLAPINALTDSPNADVSMARNILRRTSREVQAHGWDFNTEDDYPFPVDTEGNIPVAGNILRVRVNQVAFPSVNAVRRGGFFYDKTAHSFTFTQSLKGKAILFLDWEELPEPARNYIAIKAARKYIASTIGDTDLDGLQEDDEVRAMQTLKDEEADTGEHTIFDSPDMADIVNRNVPFHPKRGL